MLTGKRKGSFSVFYIKVLYIIKVLLYLYHLPFEMLFVLVAGLTCEQKFVAGFQSEMLLQGTTVAVSLAYFTKSFLSSCDLIAKVVSHLHSLPLILYYCSAQFFSYLE